MAEKFGKPVVSKGMQLYGLFLHERRRFPEPGSKFDLVSLPPGLDDTVPLSAATLILAHGFRQSSGVLANCVRYLDKHHEDKGSSVVEVQTRGMDTFDTTLSEEHLKHCEAIFLSKCSSRLRRQIDNDYFQFLKRAGVAPMDRPEGLSSSYGLSVWQPQYLPEFLSTYKLTKHLKAIGFDVLRPQMKRVESRVMITDLSVLTELDAVGHIDVEIVPKLTPPTITV